MNFDLFNDFGSTLPEFAYLLLATLRGVLYTILSADGLIGRAAQVTVLVLIVASISAATHGRFASDDDPFNEVR